MRVWKGFPLVLLLGLLLFPLTAGAAGPPDQQQTVSDGAAVTVYDLNTSKIFHSATQTFTAGKTGVLYQVDLLLSYSYFDTGTAPRCSFVTIQGPDTRNERVPVCPSGPPTSTPQWVSIPLTAPSIAGTEYTILLEGPGSTLNFEMWYGTATDTYPKGKWSRSTMYYSHSWDNVWSVQPGDAAFKTYVLTKDGCKDGGWQQVTSLGFKNQGQCIKYVDEHS